MLEGAVPWIWGWLQGWLTPAVLFVLLNLVIGTIAVTSKGIVPRDPQPQPSPSSAGGAGAEPYQADGPPRKLPRAPSLLLDRLRSFTLHPHLRSPDDAPPPPPPPPAPPQIIDPLPDPVVAPAEDDNRADPDEEEEEEEHRLHGRGHQLGRSHSDSHPAAGERPPPLAARMKKSASDKSAFAHFDEAEVADAAAELGNEDEDEGHEDEDEDEDEGGGGGGGGGGGEVDARADDFINRFRHQLKLQRLDSIMRYKETLNRNANANANAAAAAGVAAPK